MNAYLIVALGAAIGGALRHAVNVGSASLLGTGWPYGTFAVNALGSFSIGVVVAYFGLRGHASQAWLLFLTTGVLGGFTTLSAFSLDAALLWERGGALCREFGHRVHWGAVLGSGGCPLAHALAARG